MGDPALHVIAHELVDVIKGNVILDWMDRDPARSNIRRHIKRLLRKSGDPLDLQDAAVQNTSRGAVRRVDGAVAAGTASNIDHLLTRGSDVVSFEHCNNSL